MNATIGGYMQLLYRDYQIKNTPFKLYYGSGMGIGLFFINKNIKDIATLLSDMNIIKVNPKVNPSEDINIPFFMPFFPIQTTIGVDYSFNQKTKISLGYRSFYAPMISILGTSTQNIEAKLTFYF
ncbi:hypothetical protein [Wolbachia endosymbiont of Chironomus riparius]|uniref:hypothetical protein n=1 Tax=Wolbachia endosymbiont of Chironomus riparius TaxID=2883238 RepID=UPI00209FE080|nr:hypothetical protein [Wolbachia endosymbiont of Chironomus riparius]